MNLHHEADTRLHGRWPLLARIAWFALAALTLSITLPACEIILLNSKRCASSLPALTDNSPLTR